LVERLTDDELKDVQEFYERPVPLSSRQASISLFAVFMGMVFLWSNILPGGQAGAGLTFWQGVGAIIAAMAVYGVIAILQGTMSQRTGLSFGLNCRYLYGHVGTYAVNILSVIVILGWFAVTASFLGDLMRVMWGFNYYLTSSVAALIFIVVAYLGYKPIAWVAYIVGTFAVIFSVLIFTRGVTDFGGWEAVIAQPVVDPVPFGAAVLAMVGAFAHGVTTTTQNFTRFGDTQKGVAVASGIPWTIGIGFMFFIGVVAVRITGNPDIMYLGEAVGLVTVGALLLVAMTFTTLDTTVYSASLDLSAASMMKRTNAVILCGAVALILTNLRAVDYVIHLLLATGLIWPPVAASMIAHFWILHKGEYVDPKYIIPGKLPAEQQIQMRPWPYSSLIALVGGFGLALLSMQGDWFIPPPAIGFISAFVLQLVLTPLFNEKIEVPAETKEA